MNVFNIHNFVRNNIKNIKPYSSARDEFTDFGTQMIFLDANENPYGKKINRYPDPQQNEVKKILSAQKGVDTKNILLGNGSDEVLDLIFRAFCEPNQDNIIILPPTYGMYEVLANINAIAVKKVLLSDDFQPQVPQILAAVNTQTKLLFLCSPNNPTGNSFSEKKVLEILEKFNGIVVLDEAYIDFSEQESWLNKLEEYPNLIITQTLSKAYGMAGIRLGICYASSEIIKILNSIKPPYNVNQLTQKKAVKRLQKKKRIASEIQQIKASKVFLENELKQFSFVEKIYPSDANFLLIKVDNANQRYQELIGRNIVIRNRSSQALCKNCLRITVGKSTENQQLLNAFKEII